MSKASQKDIFIAFFRSGMLGYGGGPSSIPLVHKEVVDRYNWLTDDEFSDVLALANTLPGPISTKMAGYIGYRKAGWMGLLNATAATALPTIFLMVSLIGMISMFRESQVVKGMTQAVAPVVGVMLFTLTYNFFKQSKSGLGWIPTVVLSIISLIIFQILDIHPAFLIGALLVYGLAYNPKETRKKAQQVEKKKASM